MATETKIYHNTTDEPINVLGVGEIRPHDHISVTSEYHQPVVLINYPGVVEVTALSPEDQQKFYAEHRDNIDAAAAPRVEALKQADDAANAAEAAAKGLPAPAPVPRYDADGNPATGQTPAAPASATPAAPSGELTAEKNPTNQGSQS